MRSSPLQVLRSHSGLGRAEPHQSVPLRNRSVAHLDGMTPSELESVRSTGERHAPIRGGSRPSRGYHPRPEWDRRGLGRRRSRLTFAGSSRIGAFSSRTGDRRDRGGRHGRSAVRAAHQDRLNPRSEGDCRRPSREFPGLRPEDSPLSPNSPRHLFYSPTAKACRHPNLYNVEKNLLRRSRRSRS